MARTRERGIMVTLRLTETEAADLQNLMSLDGYSSRSKYIRERLFPSSSLRRRYAQAASSPEIDRRLLDLSSQIRRIGVNINQVTRWFNTKVQIADDTGKGVSKKMMAYMSKRLETLFAQTITSFEKVASSVFPQDITQQNSSYMQQITITGNLCADAEVRTGKESERMTFKVAVNDHSTEEETTTFYSCSMRRSGVLEHLRKGKRVLVVGDFRQSVTEKDSRTFVNNNIFVSRLELLSSHDTVKEENS